MEKSSCRVNLVHGMTPLPRLPFPFKVFNDRQLGDSTTYTLLEQAVILSIVSGLKSVKKVRMPVFIF